eukprot:SAG11_NODE_717_length_7606_cov_5.968563_1_plen_230_part_00
MPKKRGGGYGKLATGDDESSSGSLYSGGTASNIPWFAGQDLLRSASLVDRLFWSWVRPLVDLGVTRQINADDLPGLPDFLQVEGMAAKFDGLVRKNLAKDPEAKRFPLLRCFYRQFISDYAAAFMFSMMMHSCNLVNPLLLREFLHWAEQEGENRPLAKGLGLALCMYVMMLLRNIGGNQSTGINMVTGLQQRSCLNCLIYRKAMRCDAIALCTMGVALLTMVCCRTLH